VDLGGWLHIEMVTCPQAITHHSTNPARRWLTTFIGWTRYRYAKPSAQMHDWCMVYSIIVF